jgi:hypothetical protein
MPPRAGQRREPAVQVGPPQASAVLQDRQVNRIGLPPRLSQFFDGATEAPRLAVLRPFCTNPVG